MLREIEAAVIGYITRTYLNVELLCVSQYAWHRLMEG